jgi:hypothetical protein
VLDRIAEQYAVRVTLIAYHSWWPSPADPFFLEDFSENIDRVTFYDSLYVPHVFVDGADVAGWGGPWVRTMLDRLDTPSPLRIALNGYAADSSITATIENTSDGVVSGLLHFVLVENGLVYGDVPQNHTMRDMLPADPADLPDPPSDAAGEPITLAPGAWATRTRRYSMTPHDWVSDNLECIVFVQEDDSTREIVQCARICFPAEQPELVVAGEAVDDGWDGDGNLHLDPGETADVSVVLANLNPVSAYGVSGTIATADPYVTVLDDSAAWPDIPGGESAGNASDPFTVSADESTPCGYEIAVSLEVVADGPYTKELALEIPVGSPDRPIGPDAYGYYAYEESDDYAPSPAFDWIEIDPNLGGPGDLVWLTADDQTITRTIPFQFGLYGYASDSVSICSNGFLVLGRSDFRASTNGELPGSGVGWIMAGFWTDLDPSHWGGGRVYEYFDAAHHRYIVEFSRVEHYHPAGAGVPETFQFLLYDPEFWPTETADGELVIQYLEVNDPTLCSVGIQNGDRTIGTQYAALGEVNAATYGVAAGRATKFSTTTPSGTVGAGGAVRSGPEKRVSARPNPFRAGTTIAWGLPHAGHAAVQVFGLDGTLLRTLREGPAGGGRVWWDGTDRHGLTLPPGVYLFRVTGPGAGASGKLVRVR